jgi:nicotinamidase-related amidase
MNDVPDRDVEIFTEALRLPPGERAAYLQRACSSDGEMRRRVEALLQTHDQIGDFLEQPPQNTAIEARLGGSVGEKPGHRIGYYKLLQQIGEGGCGVVFMAEQEEPIRRRVALKIIKPGMDTRSVIARFEAERQALALMDHPNKKGKHMNQYHKLYTPADSAIVFIDQQPQMTFGMASGDRATLINNVTLLARVATEFKVPAVLTAVETESFSGYIWPQLLDIFPGQPIVERSSMNSWDDPGFRKAIEATGRKNILMTGLWTEVCITWPTIEMLGAGYNIYVVEDCCGATSPAAQEAALSRMVQAGAVRLTAIAALLEWQRDWARIDTAVPFAGVLQEHGGGSGVAFAWEIQLLSSAAKPG